MNEPCKEAVQFWAETRLRDAISDDAAILEAMRLLRDSHDAGDSPQTTIRIVLAGFCLNALGVAPVEEAPLPRKDQGMIEVCPRCHRRHAPQHIWTDRGVERLCLYCGFGVYGGNRQEADSEWAEAQKDEPMNEPCPKCARLSGHCYLYDDNGVCRQCQWCATLGPYGRNPKEADAKWRDIATPKRCPRAECNSRFTTIRVRVGGYKVLCTECGTATRWEPERADAIEAWNAFERPEETEPSETVEAIREACSKTADGTIRTISPLIWLIAAPVTAGILLLLLPVLIFAVALGMVCRVLEWLPLPPIKPPPPWNPMPEEARARRPQPPLAPRTSPAPPPKKAP